MYVIDAIEAFRQDQSSRGMAASTLANQDSFLRKLLKAVIEWESEKGKRSPMKVTEIDARLVTLYFSRCTGGTGNRGNMMVALRHFLRFMEVSEELMPGTVDKLFDRRKTPGYERQPKHYIAAKDFGKLLDCQDRHPSDRMAMALLLYTLCRRSEANGLRIKDVDLATRTLRIYREKTDRWTEVGICPELFHELSLWLMQYEAAAGPLDPSWFLLPRLTPVRLRNPEGSYQRAWRYEMDPTTSPRHMERIVKRGLDALGVKTTVQGETVNHVGEGAHTIRRSGARAMLKALSPAMGYADALVTVSAMLDHKDVKVTLKYIGMEKQKEELNDWLRAVPAMYGQAPRTNMPSPATPKMSPADLSAFKALSTVIGETP